LIIFDYYFYWELKRSIFIGVKEELKGSSFYRSYRGVKEELKGS